MSEIFLFLHDVYEMEKLINKGLAEIPIAIVSKFQCLFHCFTNFNFAGTDSLTDLLDNFGDVNIS